MYGKGLPGVQKSMEAIVFREGNPVQRVRDEGGGRGGLVAVKDPISRRVVSRRGGRIGSRLQVGDLGRGGLSFRGGNGIA